MIKPRLLPEATASPYERRVGQRSGMSLSDGSEIVDIFALMQNDPWHPSFKPQTPWWVPLVGVLILLGVLIYVLVR